MKANAGIEQSVIELIRIRNVRELLVPNIADINELRDKVRTHGYVMKKTDHALVFGTNLPYYEINIHHHPDLITSVPFSIAQKDFSIKEVEKAFKKEVEKYVQECRGPHTIIVDFENTPRAKSALDDLSLQYVLK